MFLATSRVIYWLTVVLCCFKLEVWQLPSAASKTPTMDTQLYLSNVQLVSLCVRQLVNHTFLQFESHLLLTDASNSLSNIDLLSSRSKSAKKDDRDRRRRSPTPKPTKIYLGRLTRNVIKVNCLTTLMLILEMYTIKKKSIDTFSQTHFSVVSEKVMKQWDRTLGEGKWTNDQPVKRVTCRQRHTILWSSSQKNKQSTTIMSVFSHLQVGSFRFEPGGKYHECIIYVALIRLKSGYKA